MTLRDPCERLLRAMPATRTELREKTYISRSSVTRALKAMHEAKWCYVGGWVRSDGCGPHLPVYFAGPGKDKPCKLKPTTTAERQKKCRAKAVKDGRRELQLAKDRLRKKVKRLSKVGPQNWLSALIIPKQFTKTT
jgi:hypothetical protein